MSRQLRRFRKSFVLLVIYAIVIYVFQCLYITLSPHTRIHIKTNNDSMTRHDDRPNETQQMRPNETDQMMTEQKQSTDTNCYNFSTITMINLVREQQYESTSTSTMIQYTSTSSTFVTLPPDYIGCIDDIRLTTP
eukprot:828036_1